MDQAPHELADLEDRLSTPTPELVEMMRRLDGDLLILGVGGKVGPTLARMARRASDAAGTPRRVIGVARFTEPGLEDALRACGVEAIRCDLLDFDALARLPDAPLVVFMAGRKFGSTGQEALTWAANTFLPGMVCRRFAHSRIVAFSTGNVYGLTPTSGPGSREADAPDPQGEYAMSCLGRERMVEHFSRSLAIRAALIRLNYAVEMRYGVLVDLAQKVLAGEPIDLAMGYFNAIWQADANAMALRAFEHASSPPFVLNVAGPERLSVREVAARIGTRLGRPPRFEGSESGTALLSDGRLGHGLFGPPRVPADRLIDWTADWVARGGPTLGRPTHFEVRDGRF